jgi:hypothetical protein
MKLANNGGRAAPARTAWDIEQTVSALTGTVVNCA